MFPNYPTLQAADNDPTAELQQDYNLSDPDRTKIKPLKFAKERLGYFDKVAANEAD